MSSTSIYGTMEIFVLLMKFFIMPEFTQALMLFAEPFKSPTDTDLTFERFKVRFEGMVTPVFNSNSMKKGF